MVRAQADVARAGAAWADAPSLVLGGDLNVRAPRVPLTSLGAHGVDHVLARGWVPVGPSRALDRGRLSDHAPLLSDGLSVIVITE